MPDTIPDKETWFAIVKNFTKCSKVKPRRKFSESRKRGGYHYRTKFWDINESDREKVIRWAELNGFRYQQWNSWRVSVCVAVFSPVIENCNG